VLVLYTFVCLRIPSTQGKLQTGHNILVQDLAGPEFPNSPVSSLTSSLIFNSTADYRLSDVVMADDRVKRFREITGLFCRTLFGASFSTLRNRVSGASEAEASAFLGSRQDVEVCVNEYFDSVATGGGLPAMPEPEVRAPIAPIEDVMLPPEAAFPNAAPIIVDSLRDFRVESGECDLVF
jgi:hypothetical protein